MLSLRSQLHHRLLTQALDGHAPGHGGATFLQLLDTLPGHADFPAQLALCDLEPAHGAALLFEIGEGLQAVFGLEPIQLGVGLAQLSVNGRPCWVGHFAVRIIGHRGIFDQRVQRVFLA